MPRICRENIINPEQPAIAGRKRSYIPLGGALKEPL